MLITFPADATPQELGPRSPFTNEPLGTVISQGTIYGNVFYDGRPQSVGGCWSGTEFELMEWAQERIAYLSQFKGGTYNLYLDDDKWELRIYH